MKNQVLDNDHANEIISGLWIGDSHIAGDVKFLKNKKITTIVNCTDSLGFTDYKGINHKLRVSVKDNLKQSQIDKMYAYFDKITTRINQLLQSGEVILIHCHAGKQRSVAVTTAYLMRYAKLPLKYTIRMIQTKRPVAGTPYINFLDALKRYESDLSNGRTA